MPVWLKCGAFRYVWLSLVIAPDTLHAEKRVRLVVLDS